MGASSGGKGKRVAQHKAAAVEKARHYGNRRRSRRSHLPPATESNCSGADITRQLLRADCNAFIRV